MTATVAIGALLLETIVPAAAVAQPAPPPLPPATDTQPGQSQGDPPARVGRVAAIQGAVSFHNQGDTQWSAASVNYPVSTGNAFWTEPTAETQLEISDSRIALAGGTEFEVYALDATGLQGVAAQGETYFNLRDLAPNETWSVQTPRGLVHLGGEGRYAIVVGTTDQPTLVSVVEGAAQIEGPGVSLQVNAGQTATISGTDSFQGSIGPIQRDAFLTERLNAERPPPAPAGVPAQVTAMPGGSDLYGVGSWSAAPEYGQVWYPPVSPGWAPYREGHWAYVEPWGWTWVDAAPWGFAPFHYGRWLQIGDRWAWTPGEAAVAGPPVYAPALVAFIGIGAGVALGAALASGSIGWVPLGPREPYRPWYHASENYVRQVNVSHVTNINNITNNNVTINNYVNRAAATSMPAAAMVASRPVQAVARPLTPQQLAAARPIVGQQPLRPAATTAGVTPVVARQLNLPPSPVARPAPGPVVHPPAPGAAHAAFARPALAPAGRPVPGGRAATPATATAPNPAEPNHLGAPTPENRPSATPNSPTTNRLAPPTGPGVHPSTEPRTAHPAEPPPHPTPNAAAQAAPGPHPEPHVVAPATPAPRPTPRAAPAPHAQPQVTAPAAAPRLESRPAPPPPRPEVRPVPAPRPEAAARPPAPHPEPPPKDKKPGEH